MISLDISVVGTPAPQGSKRHVGNGVMVESSKRVKPWRLDVKAAALDARWRTGHATFTGPVRVEIYFTLPRPKHHFRTGGHANELRPNAPTYVATKPDLDKLLRSTFDALGEAGVWRGDAQIAEVVTHKRYLEIDDGAHVGCVMTISELSRTELRRGPTSCAEDMTHPDLFDLPNARGATP